MSTVLDSERARADAVGAGEFDRLGSMLAYGPRWQPKLLQSTRMHMPEGG